MLHVLDPRQYNGSKISKQSKKYRKIYTSKKWTEKEKEKKNEKEKIKR